ncbi:MAG TPA: flavin reductase family protein [Rhizobium sp.]
MQAEQEVNLERDYLEAMSRVATGVSVVTTDGVAGRRELTISAVASVALEAEGPMLLVCVNDRNGAAGAIVANGCFCVNVLGEDQSPIAQRFAGAVSPEQRFEGLDLSTAPTGSPRLCDAYTSFDCKVAGDVAVGTHRVLYGRVVDVVSGSGGGPLVYSQRRFCAAVPRSAA